MEVLPVGTIAKAAVLVKTIYVQDLELGMYIVGGIALPIGSRKKQLPSAPLYVCSAPVVTANGVTFKANPIYCYKSATHHVGLNTVVNVLCNGAGQAAY